jgi:hypothetical protein
MLSLVMVACAAGAVLALDMPYVLADAILEASHNSRRLHR